MPKIVIGFWLLVISLVFLVFPSNIFASHIKQCLSGEEGPYLGQNTTGPDSCPAETNCYIETTAGGAHQRTFNCYLSTTKVGGCEIEAVQGGNTATGRVSKDECKRPQYVPTFEGTFPRRCVCAPPGANQISESQFSTELQTIQATCNSDVSIDNLAACNSIDNAKIIAAAGKCDVGGKSGFGCPGQGQTLCMNITNEEPSIGSDKNPERKEENVVCAIKVVLSAGQSCNPKTGAKEKGGTAILAAIGCIPTEPVAFVKGSLKFVSLLSGGIALLLMVFGAFRMIISSGNADELTAGQEQFKSALIGLLFIIFSVLLLEIIGVDILGIPGITKS